MPSFTPEELVAALSPQDFMARHNAVAQRAPQRRVGTGGQNLGMTFKDPTSGILEADPVEMATGIPFAGEENYGTLTRSALGTTSDLMTPAYLQEGYAGPQSGNKILDALAGLGQVFQGGSGAGELGILAPLASRALGPAGTSMGTFGGRNARFADLRKLDAAQGLEAAGAPAQDILQGTGWFKDVDGHWKFEISDQLAKLTPRTENLIGSAERLQKGQAGGGQLKDFISNPELELNYPDLMQTKTAFVGNPMNEFGPKSTGSMTPGWTPEGRQIEVPRRITATANKAENAFNTFLHEAEHGVQDIENFAPGGNPVEFARQMAGVSTKEFLETKSRILEALAKEPTLAQMPIKTDRFTHPLDVPNLVQALTQNRPSRREVKSFINWFDSRPAQFKQELLPLIKPWLKNFADLGAHPQPEDAFDYYFGLLGEANARAVPLRQSWNKQQRIDTPLEATRKADPLASTLEGYLLDFDPLKPLAPQVKRP